MKKLGVLVGLGLIVALLAFVLRLSLGQKLVSTIQTQNFSGITEQAVLEIRTAKSKAEAQKHAVASSGLARHFKGLSTSYPADIARYNHQSAMLKHLAAAAKFKTETFSALSESERKSKVSKMELEFQAARKEATLTQAEVDKSLNPL